VVFGSYVEQTTIDLFKLHLRPMQNKQEHDRIFGPNSPLGSFSARIEMAYMLRWIPERVRENLHAFRKIRNLFAHEAYKVTVNDRQVIDLFGNIAIDVERFLDRMNSTDQGQYIDIKSLSRSDGMLLALIFVAQEAFEALLVGPVAVACQVQPASIMTNWDALPARVQTLRRNVVRAILTGFCGLSDIGPAPVPAVQQ